MNFANTEESFVLATLKEVVKVWGSGGQANLHLECKDGQAWLKIGFHLGQPDTPHHQDCGFRRQKGPKRKQRDRDRAAAHRARAEEVHKANHHDDQELETADGQNEQESTPVTVAEDNTKDVNEVEMDVQEVIADSVANENVDNTADTADISVENTAVTATSGNVEIGDEMNSSDGQEKATVEATNEAATVVETVKYVVVVHATATFEDCPDPELFSEYVESFERFMFSKEHLKRNICKVETSYLSTRQFRNNMYTHTMSVRLFVLTGGLWEGPRSYIWRHLGDDVWTRGNQTKIRLVRIHVK